MTTAASPEVTKTGWEGGRCMKFRLVGPHGKKLGPEAGEYNSKGLA